MLSPPRYILAVRVTADYGAFNTKSLLLAAIAKARELGSGLIPNVFVDSGCENINAEVDSLVGANLITRTIAQIDVIFSNSLIEAWFRSLKHGHLFLQELTNVAALERNVLYYADEHNTVMPHSALKGATPFEVITGINPIAMRNRLSEEHRNALAARIAVNRQLRCGSC